MRRIVLADGDCHEVACAVVDEGKNCPVDTLLAELESGMWPEPEVVEFPDERQLSYRARLLALAEALAEGNDMPRESFNFLSDGMWELKIARLRVTFFDTDGIGAWTPKSGTRVDAWDGRSRYELPTDFDEFLRLGHYFGKTGQKAPEPDIRRSIQVRQEDVGYDRTAA